MANIVTRGSLGEVEDLFERYAQAFGRSFWPESLRMLSSDVRWRPATDIVENAEEYVIKMDLPEVKKKDINVSISEGVLTIKGERRAEKTAESEKRHTRETFYGAFERSFTLPSDVDQEKIKADHKDGVLKLQLPKTKKAQPKAIEVSVE